MSKDVPQFECRMERTCYIDGQDSMRMDYALKNYGDKPTTISAWIMTLGMEGI